MKPLEKFRKEQLGTVRVMYDALFLVLTFSSSVPKLERHFVISNLILIIYDPYHTIPYHTIAPKDNLLSNSPHVSALSYLPHAGRKKEV